MADEKIVTSIVANSDFSNLIADVQRVSSSLFKLQQEFAGANRALAGQIDAANAMFNQNMLKTGQFSSHFVSLTSDVEKFGRNLDGGRLKLKDYFRVYQENVRTSGGLIRDLAKQQVQMQNAVLQPLGKNAQGLMQYNVHIPRGLDLVKNKTALLRQEFQIMNKVIQDGGVQLINWGKNTQWAGRQLTVGLTLPLAAFGKAAADAFKVADQELTRLTKVYGDVAGTSAQELGKIRNEVSATAKELSSAMGVNFAETIGLAADIAATGKTGNELLSSVSETTRLAVLGEVDRQEAMKATLAIQSAFKSNTQELAETINFLNAVENQTSTTLNDLVEAIPKAGPVIKGLGGSVQDLALYLTAMREGGINASEGANALKSALASLINPTDVAVDKFKGFGIDLLGIVKNNAGDVTGTLMALQSALDRLDPLSKQQAIEQLFGKFQFSRLNALFENLGRQGSQTLQVLDLMKASAGELEAVAGRELAAVTESASGRYRRAVEGLKAELAGVGDEFLDIGTKLINVLSKIIDFAQKLPDPIKKLMAFGGAFTAIIGPVIMLTGVLANFFGYIIKGLGHFKALFKGAEGFQLLTPEILAAKNASSMLSDEFYSDAKAADTLSLAIRRLNEDLKGLQVNASNATSTTNALGATIATAAGTPIMTVGGGLGTPRVTDPNHPLVGPETRAAAHLNPRDPNNPSSIFGLTLQPVPVNRRIGPTPQILMSERLPDVPGLTTMSGVSTGVVAAEHAKFAALMATLGVQSQQEIEALKKTIGLGGQVSRELLDTFDDILPITSRLTANAAAQSASIVAELKAGTINVQQARAQIIAVNAQLEAMMGAEVSAYAAGRGRTIDLTKAPLINQPVVDAAGKPNIRGAYRGGIFLDVMESLGRATGTKSFGGPYSIETTRPIQRNMGGGVFYNDGDQVPGPNVNADVVPAMLTPGEFVIRRDVAQSDPEGMRLLNEGQGMVVPTFNAGGKVPGVQYLNTAGVVLSRAIRSAGTAGTQSRTTLAQTYAQRAGIGKESSRFYYDPSGRHGDRAHAFFSVKDLAARGARPTSGYFGMASVNTYNKLQNRLNVRLGTKDVNPLTDATAIKETIPDIFTRGGAGSWFAKNGVIDDGVVDSYKIRQFLDHVEDFAKTKKWDTKRFGPPPIGFLGLNDPSSKVKISEIKDYIEYLTSGKVTQVNKHGIILNDAAALRSTGRYTDEEAISEAEKIYLKAMQDGDDDWSYYSRRMDITESEYPFMIKRNRGGRIPGYINGGGIQKITKFSTLQRIREYAENAAKSRFKAPTASYPHITPSGGKSLDVPSGIGYTTNAQGQRVHVKMLPNDDAFAAEDIGAYISRKMGLVSPRPTLVRTANPLDPSGKESILAAETLFDPKLIAGATNKASQNTMDSIVRQLIVSSILGDIDMSPSNAQGYLRPDIGPGGITSKASGLRRFDPNLRSVSLTARANAGMEKIGAKSAFGKSIAPMIQAYGVKKVANKARSVLKSTNLPSVMDAFFANNPQYAPYKDVIMKRVSDANNVDWDTVFSAHAKMSSKLRTGGKIRGYNRGGKITRAAGGYNVGGLIPSQNGQKYGSGGMVPGYQFGGNIRGGGILRSLLFGSLGSMAGSTIGSRFGQTGSMMGGMLGYMIPDLLMGRSGKSGITPSQRLGLSAQSAYGPTLAEQMNLTPSGPGMYIGKGLGMGKSVFAGTRFASGIEEMTEKTGKFTPIIGKALAGITRLNLALGAAVTTVGLAKKAFDNYNETQRLSAAAFGLTSESAQKAGLKFTDYNTKVKDAVAAQKLMIDQNMMTYESLQSAGTPFKMTIAEYKKLRKELKETMAEQIKVINATSRPDAARVAVQLKEQLMAAGLSAEEAAKRIYTLFNLSDKAGQAVSVINTDAFKGIVDAQTAAASALQSFNYAKNFENTKDAAAALNTALTAINTGVEDLVAKSEKAAKKNKQEFNETAARYEAEKKQLDIIAKKVGSQEQIGEGVLNQLKKQNPEIEKFVKAQDTAVSMFQKLQLVARGFTGELANLNTEQVDAIYKLQIATAQAVETVNKKGLLASEYKAYGDLKKKRDDLAAAAKGQSVKEQIDARERLKALDKEIKKINDKAEARKKALREEAQAEDMSLRIQQQKLQYERAVSAGDFGGAAEAQIELRRLQNEQQVVLTEQQIEERRLKDVGPLEREKERLQKAQEALADKAALAAESLESINKRLEKQKEKIDNVNSAMAALKLALDLNKDDLKNFKQSDQFKGLAGDLVNAVKKAGIDVPDYAYTGGAQGVARTDVGQYALDLVGQYGSQIDTIVAQQGLKVDANGDIFINGKKVSTDARGVTPSKISGLPGGQSGTFVQIGELTQAGYTARNKTKTNPQGTWEGVEFTDAKGNNWVVKSATNFGLAVEKKAIGGLLRGPGTKTSDSIIGMYANGGMVRVSNGEYIVNADTVSKLGVPFFDRINGMKNGGLMLNYDIPRYEHGGPMVQTMPYNPDGGSSVYKIGSVSMQFAEAPANGKQLFEEFKVAMALEQRKSNPERNISRRYNQ